MQTFVQLVVGGVAIGFIYGAIALSFVFVYRASRVINLPAPEIGTLGALIAWELVSHGWPFWAAFFAVVAVCCALGFLMYQGLTRPFRETSPLRLVVVLFGVYFVVHGFTGTVWGGVARRLEAPFGQTPYRVFGVAIRAQDVGIIAVTTLMLVLFYVIFQRTKFGLGLRATAQNYTESQLNGIPVNLMLASGWAIGGGIAAVSGMMIAPTLLLGPDMMVPMLFYAFVAWIVGGVDSFVGSIVAGIAIGLAENLIGYYVKAIGTDLVLPVVLLLLILVLVIRPQGIWGTREVSRV